MLGVKFSEYLCNRYRYIDAFSGRLGGVFAFDAKLERKLESIVIQFLLLSFTCLMVKLFSQTWLLAKNKYHDYLWEEYICTEHLCTVKFFPTFKVAMILSLLSEFNKIIYKSCFQSGFVVKC